jgi:signal transduction histidine kinase
LNAVAFADPATGRPSRTQRRLMSALLAIGAALAALAIVRLAIVRPHPDHSSGALVLSVALGLVTIALVVRYPLMAWRLAFLAALLVPLLPGQPRIEPIQAVVLLVAFCAAGLRQERPALWSMAALMLLPIWLWVGPRWGAPTFVTIGLCAVTAALAAISDSRRARAELATQVEHGEVEEARRAVLEERTRMAREMHDIVAHHMSMIAVQAETAPYRLDDLTERTRAEFATLSGAARDALADMRRLLGVLRSDEPAELAPQPRLSDVPELVEATRQAGITIELHMCASDVDVPPGVGVCAYRIVQEALSNAGRHARGAPVVVRVEQGDQRVLVDVLNGPGTSVAENASGNRPGHGLVGMRERVTLLGGSLSAGPDEDGGYAVSAIVPLGERPLRAHL